MSIKMKKLMSLLMCCVMLFGMLPVEAFATETGGIAAEENVVEAPAPGTPSADDSAADPAQILYNTLKSFNDYEALCAYLKSLSAEQLEMLKKFFAEQEMDLDAWIEAFQQQETTVEESAAEPAEDQAAQEEPAAISLETSLEREVLKAGKPSKPDGNGGHGDNNPDHEVTAPDIVSHIDVACEDLTAMIGGEPVTFSFSKEDVQSGAVVIYINGSEFSGTVGESDDNAGNNQVRLNGAFDIGKENAPIE